MSSNSSNITSYGPVNPNSTQYSPAGIQPCALYENATSSYINFPIEYVLPNATLNITFGGNPPYNVTIRYLPYMGPNEGVCTNIPTVRLNTSSYLWTVGSNNSTMGQALKYGDAFVLFATGNSPTGPNGTYPDYPSNYFVVSNNTNSLGGTPAPPSSAAAKLPVSWKGAALALVLGCAILSIL